jgi:hypothetical protein
MKLLRNKIRILVFALGASLVSSCEGTVDIQPGFILGENSINTIQEVESSLLGAYDSNNAYFGIINFNAVHTDQLRIGLGNRGQGLQTHAFVVTSSDGLPTGIYFQHYDVIDQANRIIERVDQVPLETPEDNALRDQIVGEALALRAFNHFDLLRSFAPSFDATSPGVPLVLEVARFGIDGVTFPRNTVGEVLDAVNQDIESARSFIPSSANNVNRFTLTALDALQARVALYTNTAASLQQAVELATDVIDQVPLSDPGSLTALFINDVTEGSEVIFQIERDQNNGRIGTIFTDVNNDVFFSGSIDLFNQITVSDARNAIIYDMETTVTPQVAVFDGEGDLVVGKYLGTSVAFPAVNNIKVFRTGEMILIRAEANARLGNLDAAQEDIETLRTIRQSSQATPDYDSVDLALTDILLERRIELAFEGHRAFDLKRFGLGVNRIPEDFSGVGARATTSESLPAGSFRYTLPIPQAEIDANDGISNDDQNPGYN